MFESKGCNGEYHHHDKVKGEQTGNWNNGSSSRHHCAVAQRIPNSQQAVRAETDQSREESEASRVKKDQNQHANDSDWSRKDVALACQINESDLDKHVRHIKEQEMLKLPCELHFGSDEKTDTACIQRNTNKS